MQEGKGGASKGQGASRFYASSGVRMLLIDSYGNSHGAFLHHSTYHAPMFQGTILFSE
jgi:hypothetical protein